jgi:hypothetical protein
MINWLKKHHFLHSWTPWVYLRQTVSIMEYQDTFSLELELNTQFIGKRFCTNCNKTQRKVF